MTKKSQINEYSDSRKFVIRNRLMGSQSRRCLTTSVTFILLIFIAGNVNEETSITNQSKYFN